MSLIHRELLIMQTRSKHYKLITLACGDSFVVWDKLGRLLGCVLGVGLMTRKPPGITVYGSKCVFAHPCVRGKTLEKVSIHTSSFLPFIFSGSSDQTCLTVVVDTSLRVVATTGDCCKCGAQPPTPPSVSTRHGAPCGVKNAFALFSGLVIDAACTVDSGGLVVVEHITMM